MTTLVENIPFSKSYPDPHFPRMPVLYLEFLENKGKIKRHLLNKPYIPSSSTDVLKFKKPVCPENEQIPKTSFNTEQDYADNFSEKDYEKEDEGFIPDENTNTIDYVSKTIDRALGLEPSPNSAVSPDIQESEPEAFLEKQPAKNDFNAPTLQELQNQKKIVIDKEFRYTEDDEETQKERNAMYFKCEVLRRMHPNMPVPEFTQYSDPKVMKQKIEMFTEKIALNTTVDNWKRYLIIGVMVCEVVLGKLNFDMEGFAQQQITQMSTYDQLLVEIAEKNQKKIQSKWGPETRLCLMLSLNTVLFVVSKTLSKNSGFNLLGTINSMTSGLSFSQTNNMKEP